MSDSACPSQNVPPVEPRLLSRRPGALERHGLNLKGWTHVVALAGNPNTGKSTLFNALTGLRQHTGNWPGKTIARAEGGFTYEGNRFKLVDLPGTYSLLSASQDEEVSRNFILFGKPDVTVIVIDATCLERNLNLVLQVLQITNRAVVCLNLMDEARAHGLEIDAEGLSRDLGGVPVIPAIAREGAGIDELLREIAAIATGVKEPPFTTFRFEPPEVDAEVQRIVDMLVDTFPGVPNPRWVALRLLEGDDRMIDAIRSGELGELGGDHGASLLAADSAAT